MLIQSAPSFAEMAAELACLCRREAMGLEQIEILAVRDPGSPIARVLGDLRRSQRTLAAAHRLVTDLVPHEKRVRALAVVEATT